MVFTVAILAILATFCKQPDISNHDTGLVCKDVAGVLFAVRVYDDDVNTSQAINRSGVLAQAQVGKGATIPTRQDFNIENPFTNGGAEDNRATSLTATYVNATEKIEMSTAIVATGSGTITEVCKFVEIRGVDNVNHILMVSRDLVSPVTFANGETINITNEVLT